MSTFQQYNGDDLYDLTPYLYHLFPSRQELMFVMASQLTLFGDSTVSTTSTWRSYTRDLNYQKGVVVLGVWSILPFIIKRIFLAVLEIRVWLINPHIRYSLWSPSKLYTNWISITSAFRKFHLQLHISNTSKDMGIWVMARCPTWFQFRLN